MTNTDKKGATQILKQDFEKIFNDYVSEKQEFSFSKAPIARFIRNEFKNDFENLISEFPYNEIRSSAGLGNFANNPYLSIGFERQEKLGLKHVYVFKEDMSGVYLSVLCSDRFDSLTDINKKRDYYRHQIRKNEICGKEFFENVDLGRRTRVSAFLEDSIILSKFYSATNIPSDQELLYDLKVFMDYAYFLYDEEKFEKIEYINKKLETLESLMIYMENRGFDYSIIMESSKICEMMIWLYLEKEGFDNSEIRTLGQVEHFCLKENLLPKNCIDYLHAIRIYRNRSIHGPRGGEVLSKTYLETLNYFLMWFNEFYSQKYYIKNPFKIDKVSSLIQTLTYDEENIKQSKTNLKELEIETKELNEEIISLRRKLNEKDEKVELLEKELDLKTLKLKEIENSKRDALLGELADGIRILINNTDEIKETTRRTEEKVDIILNNIDDMMELLQKSTARQIDNANSQVEREKILENFTKDYLENIFLKYFKKVYKNEEYEKEKRKLQISLGENAWNKLSDKSKTFLITSKVMYNEMLMIDDIIDYSGVCIPVTKALEEELFKRFFTDFIEYLKEEYGEDYTKYHSTLIHTDRDGEKSILFEDSFSMGKIAYLLCLKGHYRQKEINKRILIDYCKTNIFSSKTEDEINDLIYDYAKNIETIRKDYRNPSAHRHEIKRINAKECFDLVLDVEKLLKRMLDSFDY